MLRDVLKTIVDEWKRSPYDRCQPEATAAVVIQTVLRPSAERAIRSVFEQDLEGRIHLLVGVDKRIGDPRPVRKLLDSAPPRVGVTLFDPGYSTSVRHGGVHSNHFGGALRTILGFAANSRHVAFLDDDDWFAPDHLSSLLAAVRGKAWAFSHRWYVNPYSLEPMCVDTLENLGPNAGCFAAAGGFACPSSLLIDKRTCAPILHLLAEAGNPAGDAEDRVFFRALCEHAGAPGTNGKATVYCVIKPEDGMHAARERLIVASGYPADKLPQGGAHAFKRV